MLAGVDLLEMDPGTKTAASANNNANRQRGGVRE